MNFRQCELAAATKPADDDPEYDSFSSAPPLSSFPYSSSLLPFVRFTSPLSFLRSALSASRGRRGETEANERTVTLSPNFVSRTERSTYEMDTFGFEGGVGDQVSESSGFKGDRLPMGIFQSSSRGGAT